MRVDIPRPGTPSPRLPATREWTVASLARQLAIPHSALAARFRELVGEPVMQYVTRWRMHLALSALREEGVTVAELGSRLGYRSEAAFSRRVQACRRRLARRRAKSRARSAASRASMTSTKPL